MPEAMYTPHSTAPAAVLRFFMISSEQCVPLIMDELGRRQMTSSAMLHGRNHAGLIADDRFSHHHLLD